MLSFYDHRHYPYVSFTAVLGVNVFQHCVSGQRSWVSTSSVKVLDALCVSAGKTDEGRTPIVLRMRYVIGGAYTMSSVINVRSSTFLVNSGSPLVSYQCPSTAHPMKRSLEICTL